MRLLVVSQYFWPEIFRVNDLVAELAARGHEVTVLTGAPNYPEGEVFPEFREHPERFASYHGARVLRVPMLARGTTRARLALNYASFALSGALVGPWRLRDATWDAIFVFQTSPITAALPALLLRRLEHTPVLLWVLDLWPESLSAVGAVRDQRLLDAVGRLVSFIYRRCDLILAQSRAFVANIERWAGSTERVRYFPGWAEAVFVDQEVATLAPELAAFREKFKVMFAGNIGEAQDLPAVLDAAITYAREHRASFVRELIDLVRLDRARVMQHRLQECGGGIGAHAADHADDPVRCSGWGIHLAHPGGGAPARCARKSVK